MKKKRTKDRAKKILGTRARRPEGQVWDGMVLGGEERKEGKRGGWKGSYLY